MIMRTVGAVGRRVMEMHGLVTGQPEITLGLTGGEIVEDHMDLPIGMVGDDPVHEGEELDPPAALGMAADDFAGRDVERGEEGGGAVPVYNRAIDR